MVVVNWIDGMAFSAENGQGQRFVMDALPESGGLGRGVSPVEALISSLAACSAMDVISVLEKKRQKVTAYRVEAEFERAGPEGVYPRPVTSVVIRHIVTGTGVDQAAVKRAVDLSDEKYCTVLATLRTPPQVSISWHVEESD